MDDIKFLHLLVTIEKNYRPFHAKISFDEKGVWKAENCVSMKLGDDFEILDEKWQKAVKKCVELTLEGAKEKENEKSNKD